MSVNCNNFCHAYVLFLLGSEKGSPDFEIQIINNMYPTKNTCLALTIMLNGRFFIQNYFLPGIGKPTKINAEHTKPDSELSGNEIFASAIDADTFAIGNERASIEFDTSAIANDRAAIKDDTSAITNDTTAIENEGSAIANDSAACKDDTSAIANDTSAIGNYDSAIANDRPASENDTSACAKYGFAKVETDKTTHISKNY